MSGLTLILHGVQMPGHMNGCVLTPGWRGQLDKGDETMTALKSASPSPASYRARHWLRYILVVSGLFLLVGVVGVLAWRRWPAQPAPLPPEVNLEGLDTALRESIVAAREKVLQHPRSSEAWGHLGKLLRTPEFNDEASSCFAEAEKLDPDNVRWPYLRGEAVMLAKPEIAVSHLRRAVEVCDRLEPDNIVPHLRYSEILVAQGMHDEAEAALRRAREKDPENPSVRLYLGLLSSMKGNLEASHRLLLSCQHSEFTRKRACLELAVLCQRLGRNEEALKFEQKANGFPKDHNWPDKYIMDYKQASVGKQTRLQYVDRLEAQGKHAEAVKTLQAILADGPDYRVLVGLGKLLGQAGDLDGAERALREAISLTTANAKANHFLSRILSARGEYFQGNGVDGAKAQQQFQAAVEAAERALLQKPDDAETLLFLGLALKALGRQREALEAFDAAVKCGPEMVETHFHLAEALANAGNAADARRHWAEVLQLAKPENPLRHAAVERLQKLPAKE